MYALFLNAANVVAIIISILFAYVTNKVIVFKAKTKGFLQTVKEFSRFIGARLFTMALEIGGVWFFATKLGLYDLAVKAAVTVVVIIANYVLSKLLVFRKK
jgi:putative flippase GtrA